MLALTSNSPYWTRLRWGWLAPILAALVYTLAFRNGRWTFVFRLVIGEGMIALLLALTLAWCIANATSVIGRLLDSKPLRAIGILSYSLYLWQEPFLSPEPIVAPRWALAAVLATALASYYLVERPGLSLKQRFERPRFVPARA